LQQLHPGDLAWPALQQQQHSGDMMWAGLQQHRSGDKTWTELQHCSGDMTWAGLQHRDLTWAKVDVELPYCCPVILLHLPDFLHQFRRGIQETGPPEALYLTSIKP
ncbi:hypothetical protein AMECASPLE_032460, partial [Ameca splendens]